MYEILMVVYLVLALALIGFILIQKGKGAGMGASFGAGASGTVFGSSGSGNFLTKTTTFLAIGFFVVALALGNLTSDRGTEVVKDGLFTEEDLAATKTDSEVPAMATEVPTEIPKADNAAATNSEIPKAVEEEAKKEEEKPEDKDDKS